jgi:hypothetical protein
MSLNSLTNLDLQDIAEEILEDTFTICNAEEAEILITEMFKQALDGDHSFAKIAKIERLQEAFENSFKVVNERSARTAIESFSFYRRSKKTDPCAGNVNVHNRLIAEDRSVVKSGLESMLEKVESPEKIESDRRKDDDLFGSPNKKKSHNKSTSQGQRMGGKSTIYKEEDELQEKDTYDQVAAVIDMYRSKKGTDDATYDSEHGKKKQAKKERDYAAFERKKMKRDAQRSGHPWEHAKGSTKEKEGKKSEKTKHVRDPQYNSYEPDPSIERLIESGKFSQQEIERIIEVDRLGKSQVSESGWHRRNPDKVGTPADPDYDVLRGKGKPVKASKPATTGKASKQPPGIYKPNKEGKFVRQPD